MGEESLKQGRALGRDTLSETENRKEATVTGVQWQVGVWALMQENREGSETMQRGFSLLICYTCKNGSFTAFLGICILNLFRMVFRVQSNTSHLY